MHMRMHQPHRAVAVLALFALAGCGGGGSSPSQAGSPQATPAPNGSPAATPKPDPTPTPDPRPNLAPGPVVRYTIKIRTVNNGERDAEQDNQGRWVVHPGERVDFDSTQKNAGDQICQWRDTPHWLLDGREVPLESDAGVVYRRGSTQPFLLKLTMQTTGEVLVQGTLDGVVSNVMVLKSVN
jgi:hypothetical protein